MATLQLASFHVLIVDYLTRLIELKYKCRDTGKSFHTLSI